MRKFDLKYCLAVFVVVLTLFSISALAGPDPEGPVNLTQESSSSRSTESSKTLEAIAGNVTQLNIFAYTQTRSWQGYYGNVTGTITLDDSSGYTLYDWDLAEPSGEILASTAELDFSDGNIECYNFSKSGGSYNNLSAYESSLSLTESSADGINETFNESIDYTPFYIGTTYINDTCPVVYLFNGSNESTINTYQEVLLYDLTADNVIFTSIIRNGGIVGFNNLEWDFQMVVAEDGHRDDDQTTTYFFYVALE